MHAIAQEATVSYQGTTPPLPNNGAVLNLSPIICKIMSSAAESELGALFLDSKAAVSMWKTFEELGYPQPKTPIQTDNKTIDGLINNKIVSKATKSTDINSTGSDAGIAKSSYATFGDQDTPI